MILQLTDLGVNRVDHTQASHGSVYTREPPGRPSLGCLRARLLLPTLEPGCGHPDVYVSIVTIPKRPGLCYHAIRAAVGRRATVN